MRLTIWDILRPIDLVIEWIGPPKHDGPPDTLFPRTRLNDDGSVPNVGAESTEMPSRRPSVGVEL